MNFREHDSNVKRKKGPIVFTRRMKIRLSIISVVIALAMIFLLYRIIDLQAKSGDEYAVNVLQQKNYSSKVIPYKRGDIVDRNGVVLATSIKVYNMILDPKVMTSDNGKYLEPTLNALSECFGYDKEEIRKIVKDNNKKSYYIYEKKLTYEQIEEFLKIQEDTKNNPYVQGVWFETEYERKYPFSSLASHVIGFTAAGNVGNWGIEEYYNSYLNGTDGREYGYVNSDNIMEKVIKKPEDGDTVVSTIDSNIQGIVEKYIAQYNEEYDPEHIGVIIMDPNNGDILSMAGKLTYDLNNPRDLTKYYTEEQISAMTDDDKLSALNEIWRNYCISDSYEPGSTAKPFTIAAALEEGYIKKEDQFMCDGGELVDGWYIKCHNHSGHGLITVSQAIAFSCNDALMSIGFKEGAYTFVDYQNRFGIGTKTRIDLPGELSCDNLIYNNPETMKKSDLVTNAFGQNFNLTMIQMATGFCSLINGGYYYQPRVVNKIVNSNGGIVSEKDKVVVKQTVTKQTCDDIKEGLRLCVSGGTGKTAAIDGYLISGKTGTAEKYPRKTGKYLLSFIGFAPYENPQVMCYVVVDNPNVEGEQLTSYATKLWTMIMSEVLPYMGIQKDDPDYHAPEVQEPQTPDTGSADEEVFSEGGIFENEEGGEEMKPPGTEENNTQ